MSVEFEKVVLEKLKVLDELKVEVNNLSKKVDINTLSINNLSDKVNKLEVKVDENTALIDNLTGKIEKLEEKVDNNTASINSLSFKVKQLEEKVDNNTTLINNLTKDVHDTQDILKIQGQNLAKFEHEYMLKLNALFDSFVSNSESHAVFSKFIAQLNAESFDYRQRISKLEDYFRSSKILATN